MTRNMESLQDSVVNRVVLTIILSMSVRKHTLKSPLSHIIHFSSTANICAGGRKQFLGNEKDRMRKKSFEERHSI